MKADDEEIVQCKLALTNENDMLYLSEVIKCAGCETEVRTIDGIKEKLITWLDAYDWRCTYILKTKK